MPRAITLLFIAGMLLLSLAASDAKIWTHQTPQVAVMVDLSASTRGAAYRDRSALQKRIDQLLGGISYRIVEFSNESADHTEFIPDEKADAILLFSDARFQLPVTAKPIFVAVDPKLENPPDAAIVRLVARGDHAAVAIVRNAGASRSLEIPGTNQAPTTIPSGTDPQLIPIDPGDHRVVNAHLTPGDAWPENDALTLNLPVPRIAKRWWIGQPPVEATSAWRVFAATEMPADPTSYLAPGIVVLNNISADAISAVQQERLTQYVRDLGGGLLLLGGDHAFGAGDYIGSAFEALSPLASAPQNPQREWVILVDSSGSMASPSEDGTSRWQRASSAAAELLAHLPPHDSTNIGSFARDLRFWAPAAPAGDLAKLSLPPSDIIPQGPTNLDAILQSIAGKLDPGSRIEIIIISDADTTIADPEDLAMRYRDVSARVHLLAIGKSVNTSVQKFSALTSGSFAQQPDAARWVGSLRQLFLSTLSDRKGTFPVDITFEKDLATLPVHPAATWNRTWLKENATLLASGDDAGSRTPLAAIWRFGNGMVGAAAFPASGNETDKLANLVARKPRDTGFKVFWTSGDKLSVQVESTNASQPSNNLNVSLLLGDETDITRNSKLFQVPQIAPGRYETAIPAPRSAVMANVRVNEQVIDRFVVAGRYKMEFDEIGNDHARMTTLARESGGAVIETSNVSPINLPKVDRPVSLTATLASAGAACIAFALFWWKRG